MGKGKVEAGIILPDWPDYCRDEMPSVEPKLGEPSWGTQRRWEVVRDNETRRVAWCAGHYDETRKRMSGMKESE